MDLRNIADPDELYVASGAQYLDLTTAILSRFRGKLTDVTLK